MTLHPSEIERIEADAQDYLMNYRGSSYEGITIPKAYVSGAQAEAVRGRERMAGVLNFAHEMDLELVLRDNGDHQWADFSTNPTTYYTAQQIADLYILDTQKRKG